MSELALLQGRLSSLFAQGGALLEIRKGGERAFAG